MKASSWAANGKGKKEKRERKKDSGPTQIRCLFRILSTLFRIPANLKHEIPILSRQTGLSYCFPETTYTRAWAFMAADATRSFPEVQGGGSLIVAWQVKGKKVLVVGGGEVRDVVLPDLL